MKRSILLFAAMLVLLPALALKAQVTTGGINGLITDKAGKQMPGVRVMATHEPSGTKYGAVSNVSGRYLIPGMRTGGPYTLQFTSVGMKPEKYSDIYVKLGETSVYNAKLDEGEVKLSEITVVSKKNATMSAERTGAATNIGRETIQALPTLNRSVQDMTRLTPQANGLSFAGQDPRFTSFSVDGSVFNNNFGLQGAGGGTLPGSQTGASPISLDAIEELQVNMAPYDVRQAGFVGAGINAITRKGDNQFRASLFYNTRNQNIFGTTQRSPEGVETKPPINNFNVQQLGFRLGGPIIEDKLFFFINGEIENRIDPGTLNRASTGPSDTNASNIVRRGLALSDSLNRLKQFLIDRFQFDPGVYENYERPSYSAKATARLDFNIDESNKLSLRYNYLRSFADVVVSNSGAVGSRANNLFALQFSGSNYRQNNDLNSVVAEYNGTFNNEWFLNAIVGFTANRDYREILGSRRFPLVDIVQGGLTITSFGDEPFTPNNRLFNDTYQAQFNVTRYLGEHVLTAGFNGEYFTFENGFTPQISGVYQFNSFTDFYNAANGQNVTVRNYTKWFSSRPGGEVPFAFTRALQAGLYLQDEWAVTPQFKLTIGVRADLQTFEQTALTNPQVPNLRFLRPDNTPVTLRTEQLPTPQVLFSPRLGFNWDVTGDRTTQIRGGAGIFTGRIPFVVISNQVGNTGMFNGSYNSAGAQLNTTNILGTTTPIRWSDNINANIPADFATRVPASAYNIAVSDPNFRYPQVFRANLAFDQELPGGILFTAEGVLSQNISAILYQNVNQVIPTQRFSGADNRFRYPGSFGQNATGITSRPGLADSLNRLNPINPTLSDAILLTNTNQGGSFTATGQLQKSFTDIGLNIMAAYTYSQARDLTDFGSIAQSSWRDIVSVDGNNYPRLTFSSNDMTDRIVANVGYTLNWGNLLGESLRFIGRTSINIFFNSQSQNRFSYTVRGDLNGDTPPNLSNNDLMFVPNDESQILFENLVIGAGAAARTFTPAQQWATLKAYIDADPYLKTRGGQYAERNGGFRAMLTRMDVSLTHDFVIDFGGKPTAIQGRVDMFNALNFIDNRLGIADVLNLTNPLEFRGVVTDASGAARPRYRLASATVNSSGNLVLPSTLRQGADVRADVWNLQFGIRITFN
ncbi:MAG: TonB-dependent receptor [Candidatus Kapaibacteriota bacterium]